MSQKIVYTEVCETSGKENVILKLDNKLIPQHSNSSIIKDLLSTRYLKSFIKEVFLPKGFPDSVHRDYIAYQTWDTVQAFASTILGTLTTHSILQGVGVGESTATPLAAAISWILKDGTGMIGRILFAWWNGSELDAQSKKWRLCADILNDIAMGLELSLAYFSSSSVTLILCVSTSMKSIVGVAGGATRAAITQHQALTNNLADVSAKDGSQETFVNLVASLIGIFILSTLQNSFFIGLYLLLVAIHIYANYSAVKALRLNSLNEDRLAILLNDFIMTERILDVEEVNRHEPLLPFQKSSKKYCGFSIKLGASLSKIMKNGDVDSAQNVLRLTNLFGNKKHLIFADMKREVIYVALRKKVQPLDVLRAYFEAFFHGVALSLVLERRQDIIKRAECSTSGPLRKIYYLIHYKTSWENPKRPLSTEVINSVDRLFPREFEWWYELLEMSEWNHNHSLLPVDHWRGNWRSEEDYYRQLHSVM